MKWERVKDPGKYQFRRLTGVKRAAFDVMMVDSLHTQRLLRRRCKGRGRKALLRIEDQLLLLLMYYREYRTQLSIGLSFGLSESRTATLIREVEGLLLKDKRFHLQGKKVLLDRSHGDVDEGVVIIDVTESPVERPKKSSAATIRVKRSDIP